MSFELVFTSTPKGLKPGTRGFTSVAFSAGMPANYVQLCESLSGYVHVYLSRGTDYDRNPVCYSHLLVTTGGRNFSVLSRVGANGFDYTGRTNKIAHHVMVSPKERVDAGPAVVMAGGGFFFEKWGDEVRYLDANRLKLPPDAPSSLKATSWERMTGDAGNAGVLAQSFLDDPSKPAFILFEPGMGLLPLIAEAQALLPRARRWELTFSTYYTALPVGMDCVWRCCLPDAAALKGARRTPNTLVVDLVNRKITGQLPNDDSLVKCARSGEMPPSDSERNRAGSLPATALPIDQAIRRRSPRLSDARASTMSPRGRPAAPSVYEKRWRPWNDMRTGIPLTVLFAALAAGMVMFVYQHFSSRREPEPPAPANPKTEMQKQDAVDASSSKKNKPPEGPGAVSNSNETAQELKKPETTNATATPLPTTPQVPSNSLASSAPPNAAMPQRDKIVDKVPEVPESAGFEFFDTTGNRIQTTQKGPWKGITQHKYTDKQDGRTLLGLNPGKYPGRVALDPPDAEVQMIRVSYGGTNLLWVCHPPPARVVPLEQGTSYRLEFAETEATRLLISALASASAMEISAKATKTHADAKPVSATFNVSPVEVHSSLKSVSITMVDRDKGTWVKTETELKDQQKENQQRVDAAHNAEVSLNSSTQKLACLTQEFANIDAGKKKEEKKSKEVKEQKEQGLKKLREGMSSSISIYLSTTNLPEFNPPDFTLWKQEHLAPLKKGGDSSLNKGYDANDSEVLKKLIGELDVSKIIRAAENLAEMCGKRAVCLKKNREQLKTKQDDIGKRLETVRNATLSFEVSCGSVIVLKGEIESK